MRIETEVEVYLDDFYTDDIIDALDGRKLDHDQCEALRKILREAGAEPGPDEFERATRELLAGRKREALVWLERGLGYLWMGVLA